MNFVGISIGILIVKSNIARFFVPKKRCFFT